MSVSNSNSQNPFSWNSLVRGAGEIYGRSVNVSWSITQKISSIAQASLSGIATRTSQLTSHVATRLSNRDRQMQVISGCFVTSVVWHNLSDETKNLFLLMGMLYSLLATFNLLPSVLPSIQNKASNLLHGQIISLIGNKFISALEAVTPAPRITQNSSQSPPLRSSLAMTKAVGQKLEKEINGLLNKSNLADQYGPLINSMINELFEVSGTLLLEKQSEVRKVLNSFETAFEATDSAEGKAVTSLLKNVLEKTVSQLEQRALPSLPPLEEGPAALSTAPQISRRETRKMRLAREAQMTEIEEAPTSSVPPQIDSRPTSSVPPQLDSRPTEEKIKASLDTFNTFVKKEIQSLFNPEQEGISWGRRLLSKIFHRPIEWISSVVSKTTTQQIERIANRWAKADIDKITNVFLDGIKKGQDKNPSSPEKVAKNINSWLQKVIQIDLEWDKQLLQSVNKSSSLLSKIGKAFLFPIRWVLIKPSEFAISTLLNSIVRFSIRWTNPGNRIVKDYLSVKHESLSIPIKHLIKNSLLRPLSEENSPSQKEALPLSKSVPLTGKQQVTNDKIRKILFSLIGDASDNLHYSSPTKKLFQGGAAASVNPFIPDIVRALSQINLPDMVSAAIEKSTEPAQPNIDIDDEIENTFKTLSSKKETQPLDRVQDIVVEAVTSEAKKTLLNSTKDSVIAIKDVFLKEETMDPILRSLVDAFIHKDLQLLKEEN